MAKQQSKSHMLHPSMRRLHQGLTKHKKHVCVPFWKDVRMRPLHGTPLPWLLLFAQHRCSFQPPGTPSSWETTKRLMLSLAVIICLLVYVCHLPLKYETHESEALIYLLHRRIPKLAEWMTLHYVWGKRRKQRYTQTTSTPPRQSVFLTSRPMG